jgi:lauroyl/myristoyl acyltransferase
VLAHLPSCRFATARAAYTYAGLARPGTELDRLVLAGALHRWRYTTRAALLGDPRRRARLQARIRIHGAEHIDRALSADTGIVLVSVHLGDFDLGGAWLAETTGRQVVTVAGGRTSPLAKYTYGRVRATCGIHVRSERITRVADLEHDLRCRRIVSLMLDRYSGRAVVPAQFLGRPAAISAAPLILAARTGAPVVIAALQRSPEQDHHLARFFRASPYDPTGPGHVWLEQILSPLENLLRATPEQWHIPPRLAQLPWRGGLLPG